MPSFMPGPMPLVNPFGQGPPSPAIPGVNAPIVQEPESVLSQIGHGVADAAGGVMSEGMAGLLDPVGMMDRQRAARELQKKFQIVGDDHQGERLPNQVSAEEYEKIVRTYSDIRLGRSDLKIDGATSDDPEAYRANTMDDIGDIMQTTSGRALINQLSNNVMTDATGASVHRTTTLHPRFVENPDGTAMKDPTTGAKVLDTTNAAESGSSAAGVGSPFADGRPGLGGNTSISFNPNQDVKANSGSIYRSDVALFHEMVHSLHDTRGTTDTAMVSPLDGIRRELAQGDPLGAIGELVPDPALVADAGKVKRYEHQAVGLGLYRDNAITENAYRRERNQVALSGQGMSGDFLMEQRRQYRGANTTYNDFFGM